MSAMRLAQIGETEMKMISEAKTLSGLCETLNELGSDEVVNQGYDGSDFPTFGGIEPQDTEDVWSYDAKYIMVLDEDGSYGIKYRCLCCGQAPFHCLRQP